MNSLLPARVNCTGSSHASVHSSDDDDAAAAAAESMSSDDDDDSTSSLSFPTTISRQHMRLQEEHRFQKMAAEVRGSHVVDQLYDSESVLPEGISAIVPNHFSSDFSSHDRDQDGSSSDDRSSTDSNPDCAPNSAFEAITRRRYRRPDTDTNTNTDIHTDTEVHQVLQYRNHTGLTEKSDATTLHYQDLEASLGKSHDASDNQPSVWAVLECTVYLCFFGIVGSILRKFSTRFFGADCEMGADAVQDFLTPLSTSICITAGGRTLQTGGALFRDLPSNLIGSFLIGLITPRKSKQRRGSLKFPWLSSTHPIQNDATLHTALGAGFCGCLTSFASWNSQMVLMLDGSSCQLGSQIASAIFGYLLGIITSVSAFRTASHINAIMTASQRSSRANNRQELNDSQRVPALSSAIRFQRSVSAGRAGLQDPNNNSNGSKHLASAIRFQRSQSAGIDNRSLPAKLATPSKPQSNNQTSNRGCLSIFCCTREQTQQQQQTQPIISLGCASSTCWIKFCIIVVVAVLIGLCSFGAYVSDIMFYKDGLLVILLTPIGVVLRWRLAVLNDKAGLCGHLSWVPWGTLIANILASVISISCYAMSDTYGHSSIYVGVRVGLAGSLSTVSTFAKEIVLFSDKPRGFVKACAYATCTILLSMSTSLCVYKLALRL